MNQNKREGNVLIQLTDREKEVLQLLWDTSGNLKKVCADLEIQPTTLKCHLKTVYLKFGITGQARTGHLLKALRIALNLGIIRYDAENGPTGV